MDDEHDYLQLRAEAEFRLAAAADDARAAAAHAEMAREYLRRLSLKKGARGRRQDRASCA